MIQNMKGHKTFWAKETPILHTAENHYQPHKHADTLIVASRPITVSPHLATGVYNPVIAV